MSPAAGLAFCSCCCCYGCCCCMQQPARPWGQGAAYDSRGCCSCCCCYGCCCCRSPARPAEDTNSGSIPASRWRLPRKRRASPMDVSGVMLFSGRRRCAPRLRGHAAAAAASRIARRPENFQAGQPAPLGANLLRCIGSVVLKLQPLRRSELHNKSGRKKNPVESGHAESQRFVKLPPDEVDRCYRQENHSKQQKYVEENVV